MMTIFVGLVFYVIASAGVCASAIVLGGKTERRVAIGYLVTAAMSVLASAIGRSHWHGANWGVMAVDVAFLGWMTAIACRSDRFWPLWAAASQLAGVIAHLPAIILPFLPMTLYATTQPFWAFPILAFLLIGTIASRKPSPLT